MNSFELNNHLTLSYSRQPQPCIWFLQLDMVPCAKCSQLNYKSKVLKSNFTFKVMFSLSFSLQHVYLLNIIQTFSVNTAISVYLFKCIYLIHILLNLKLQTDLQIGALAKIQTLNSAF